MPIPKNQQDDPIETSASKSKACPDDEMTRSYYYDDAHGYEEYDPDKESDETETDE